MRMLFVATSGSHDPTRAAIPLVGAAGALADDHEPSVALLGEAAYLANESVANEVNAVAFGNVGERMRQLADGGVPFYI